MIRRINILALFLPLATALSAHAVDTVKFKPLGVVYQDGKNEPLKNPEGIACNKTSITVADTGNGRLVRYDLIADVLKGGTEIKSDKLTYPLRLQSTSKGELLALDGKTRKVVKFAADGSFNGVLAPQNIPAPDDITPRSIAVDAKDNIYLLDIMGERVLVLDPSGMYLRHLAFPTNPGIISDVTVDQRGNIFILDSQMARVFKAATNETAFKLLASGLQSYLAFAVTIDSDSQGRLYLLDQNDNGVVVLGQDGSFLGRYLGYGWKAGELNYASQACLLENGTFAVADRNNSRVQLFKIQ